MTTSLSTIKFSVFICICYNTAMSKNKLVFSIGLILLVMPLLGFPPLWKNFFSIIFGLTLIALSFSVAAKRRASARKTRRTRDQQKDTPTTPIFVDKDKSVGDISQNEQADRLQDVSKEVV